MFLILDPLPDEQLQTISNPEKKKNTRRKGDVTLGEMFPKTRAMLRDFYKPHNDELGRLLGDSFNYNNDEDFNV